MFGSLNDAGNHIVLNICMPASCNALIAAGSFQPRPQLEHLTISIGMDTATDTATAMPTQARPGLCCMAIQAQPVRLIMV